MGIVCALFNKKPMPGQTIAHHKNNDKLDNSAENLEWVSQSENILRSYEHHPHKGRHVIYQICPDTGQVLNEFSSITSAARFFQISDTAIKKALRSNRQCKGLLFKRKVPL